MAACISRAIDPPPPKSDAENTQLSHIILELSDDGIVAIDAAQRIVTFSPAAERLTGYPAAELIGQALSTLIPERLRPGHDRLMAGFAGPGSGSDRIEPPRELKLDLRRKDGSEFPARIRIARSETGGVPLLVAMFRDISPQQDLARALQDSEARRIEAQRIARLGDWEWHARSARGGRAAISWSGQVGVILGLAAGGPERFLDRVHPADRGTLRMAIRRAARQRQAFGVKHRILGPDGAVRWVRHDGMPLVDDKGRVTGWRGLLRDVTEASEASERLHRALGRAEAGSRAKSHFLANVSHELRTPLNAIIGFGQMMDLQIFGPLGHPKYAEYAGDIRHSADHLLAIVNDLLDMARIEERRLEIDRRPTAIAPLIEASFRMVDQQAGRAGLSLAIDIPQPLPDMALDANRITQVLVNVLSNAIKFTPAGGRITVRAFGMADHLIIAVEDTGIGMTPAELAVAQTPFGQAANPLTRRHSGTGLGLSIATALVELHRGRLRIDSLPGQGTTVTMQLPIACPSDV